jgi:quinol monooxygenase YgiN
VKIVRTLTLTVALAAGAAAVWAARPADDKQPDLFTRLEAKLGSGEKPFSLIVTVKLKPGTEAKFEEVARKVVAATRQEKGNRAYEFHRDLEDPTRYVLVERWQSVAALKEHFAAEHTKAALAALGELGAEPPQIRIAVLVGE